MGAADVGPTRRKIRIEVPRETVDETLGTSLDTLMVEAEVPNERAFLRPGAFARVEIMTEVSQPVVTVPASSIIVFAGVEKVLVVRQGKTAEVRVTTGRRLGEDVEIVDGLKRGEDVVLVPGNLVGGQPVKATP